MNSQTMLIKQLLAEAFAGVLSEEARVGQEISAPDISDLLPTIKISERGFGNVGNKDRVIIEKFTASLGGTSTSVEEKLTQINDILSGAKNDYSISQILTVMMVIETLSAILSDFTEAAGGFLFEGFLAGLFGGQSVQIESAEDVARATGESAEGVSGKPITDVLLGGKHYSLKLLGKNTAVQGSFANMIKHFRDFDHVIYLDARVTNERTTMEFSEFEITLENFLDVFYEPFKKMRTAADTMVAKDKQELQKALQDLGDRVVKMSLSKRLGGKTNVGAKEKMQFADIMSMPEEELNKLGPFKITYLEEAFAQSTKATTLFGSPENLARVRQDLEQYRKGKKEKEEVIKWLLQLPGAVNSEQFNFTPGQVEKIGNHKIIGNLVVGKESMQKIWLQYGALLKSTIEPVYRNLNEFTRNINSYFLDAPEGGSRFDHGRMAMTDAKELKIATDAVVASAQFGQGLSADEKIEAASKFNLDSQSKPGISKE